MDSIPFRVRHYTRQAALFPLVNPLISSHPTARRLSPRSPFVHIRTQGRCTTAPPPQPPPHSLVLRPDNRRFCGTLKYTEDQHLTARCYPGLPSRPTYGVRRVSAKADRQLQRVTCSGKRVNASCGSLRSPPIAPGGGASQGLNCDPGPCLVR